jgi:Alpha/beta hydrolase domain
VFAGGGFSIVPSTTQGDDFIKRRREMKSKALGNRIGLALVVIAALAVNAIGATPVPKVSGPMPVTAASYPFGAADHTLVPQDLKRMGYIEEEFLISGAANVYDWPELGPVSLRAANAPYTTRVLVRRPIDRTKFSGNVAVEMLNPSNRFDLNIGWALSSKEFVRNGDAWVGITAKPIAVAALKSFNPERYKNLSWANPVPLDDARNCAQVAMDSERTAENGLVWDIYTQVGAWLRSREKSNPLAYGVAESSAHPVVHLYGWGFSQIGGFLVTYANAIHPLDVKTNGKPMFDGYLIGTPVLATPINQCAAPIPANDPRRLVHNTGVPVIRVMTQSDYLLTITARQPDSDTAAERFRNYEIAGAGHATPDELNFSAAPADIIKAQRSVPPMSCTEGPRSRFPSSVGFNAAWHNLIDWVGKGIPAPHAEPIRVENGKPVLDEFGNVTGGVRSPFVDVPTSTWSGSSTGESFCFIAGHEVAMDAARIKQLYPDHKTYETRVTVDVEKLVKERWLTRVDGDELIAEAKRARVP